MNGSLGAHLLGGAVGGGEAQLQPKLAGMRRVDVDHVGAGQIVRDGELVTLAAAPVDEHGREAVCVLVVDGEAIDVAGREGHAKRLAHHRVDGLVAARLADPAGGGPAPDARARDRGRAHEEHDVHHEGRVALRGDAQVERGLVRRGEALGELGGAGGQCEVAKQRRLVDAAREREREPKGVGA